MPTTTTPIAQPKTPTTADNQKGIENHKKAAAHLDKAAEHHIEAANHHEAGNHDKAAASTLKAHGHVAHAQEAQNEDVKTRCLS